MKNVLNKVKSSLKKNGVKETVKKSYRAVKYRVITKIRKRSGVILGKYVDLNSFNNVIIFENNFGWGKIMKQRPQQIAENLPSDTLMVYHSNEDKDFDNKSRIKVIKDNLILIDLGYYRDALLKEIKNSNRYLMIYSTDFIELDRVKLYEKNGYKVIYEYVDDINEDLMGKEMYELLSERHKELMNDNNVFISCTATLLQNKIKEEFNRDSVLITNGVNYEHFEVKEYEVPEDLVDIKNNHKYLIGYYGALATWFDYSLIKKLAKNKDYGIVLIGQDYDKTLEKSKILDLKNVYYLGRKDYNDLPKYGCNLDILMIPFIINDITLATSPVKIFEYMAMEKPIVTTDLPECRKYKSVLISKDHDMFLDNIEKAIKLIGDKKYIKVEVKEAKDNDWKEKASNLINSISEEKNRLVNNTIKEAFNSKYKRVIIWRSPFGWDVPLFQRPQHIARQLAKKNCLVFYEITKNTDNVDIIKKEMDNLYLVNFENKEAYDLVMNKVKELKVPKYIQIYSTNWTMSLDEMKGYIKDGFNILYEYIDDISPELAGTDEIPKEVLDKYNYCMEHKEIPVIVTANKIYEDVNNKRKGKNFAFSCNGVDYDFFKEYSDFEYEEDFLNLINNGKINLCYYGALAKWFDYDLIRKINDTDKYNIILFGIKYDNAYDDSKIDKLKNVHFLGSKDYHILKYYASKMDILTIPFVLNDITRATSPLKLFEYMALQKPIVTSAMDECKKYKSVLIGNDHDEFIEKLEECSKLSKDKKYLDLLDKEAKENDWSAKADVIIDLLEKNE